MPVLWRSARLLLVICNRRRGHQRLNSPLGWEFGVPAGLQQAGEGFSLSASPQRLNSPQVSRELLTPAELAGFSLHYGALRWQILEQLDASVPDGLRGDGRITRLL